MGPKNGMARRLQIIKRTRVRKQNPEQKRNKKTNNWRIKL